MLQAQSRDKSAMKVLIAAGSNLPSNVGDARRTVAVALELLAMDGIVVRATSRLFSTPAFPVGSGPDFVNGAASVETALPADRVLAHLHAIEAKFGRTRDKRWEARVLDLDLLAYGDAVLPDIRTFRRWQSLGPLACRTETPDRLILPHPRMQDRGFVLVPLMDVAPQWRHPVSGLTVTEMVASLSVADKKAIVPLDAVPVQKE